MFYMVLAFLPAQYCVAHIWSLLCRCPAYYQAWNQRLHVGLVQEPLIEGSNDNVLYFTHSTLRRYVWPIIVLLIKEPLSSWILSYTKVY